jgi:hypothetical protein
MRIYGKIFGAVLGWMLMRHPAGAVLGAALGHVFDAGWLFPDKGASTVGAASGSRTAPGPPSSGPSPTTCAGSAASRCTRRSTRSDTSRARGALARTSGRGTDSRASSRRASTRRRRGPSSARAAGARSSGW